MRFNRYRARALALQICAILIFTVAAMSVVACGPKTAPLTAAGELALKQLQVTQVVNDSTDAAIAANKIGKLSDTATAQILTINKQVLDVIKASPSGFSQQALTVIQNAKQALPPDLQRTINDYITKTIDKLMEVR